MSWPLDSLVGFQYQRATDQASLQTIISSTYLNTFLPNKFTDLFA